MSPEKWAEFKARIKEGFKDVEITNGKLPEPQVGEAETVLFTGHLGRMKLEYITKPVLLDKKTHGSRRIGGDTSVEYIYSETEFTHQLRAYVWNDEQDDWVEIDMKQSFHSS